MQNVKSVSMKMKIKTKQSTGEKKIKHENKENESIFVYFIGR